MSKDKKKIIERVRALMAMAADESSPREAAIAAKRARSLMDSYQLDQGDLIKDDSEYGETSCKAGRSIALWKNILATDVAIFNDCVRGDYHQSGWRYVGFQGFEADAKVCEFMYAFLVETGLRLYKQDKSKYCITGNDGRNSYLLGYSRQIIRRLRQITEERKATAQQSVQSRDLMVIKSSMVEKHFGKKEYTNHDTAKNISQIQSAMIGAKAAKNVHLGSVVENENVQAIA